MTEALNKLVYSLFGKHSLEDCSTDELRSFTEKYPYYQVGHLLLNKKLVNDEPESGRIAAARSSIYYNNPLWVQFVLDKKNDVPEIQTTVSQEEQPALQTEEEEDPYNDEIVFPTRRFFEEYKAPVVQPPPVVKEPDNGEEKPLKEEKPVAQEVIFEPFHTVDYFASQGIKTVLEDKPADKFGKQLKSFTDWLKSMKRLPESAIASTVTQSAEENVMHMAEHSIENREVVTESMAEVWIKQGQKQKAIEIYNKLSLLNPSKSAYFASLIENLKQT